jgi:hypothetical protein
MPAPAHEPSKVIIVGAPRSGTNMLRDVLTAIPGVGTWPCDEINAIWRHGHLDYPFDDIDSSRATPAARQFVRQAFAKQARRGLDNHIVEKTCATSLRVNYVARLLPEAKFIFIYRDGYDAVASAIRRWRSEVDLAYALRKLRYAPVTDLSHYGLRFVTNRLAQIRDPERRLPTWGPLTPEIAELGRRGDVVAAAATQWAQCVSAAIASFDGRIDPGRVVRVRYEDLISQPEATTARLVEHLLLNASEEIVTAAVSQIRADRSGLGVGQLAAQGHLHEVAERIEPVRQVLDYEPVVPR